MRGVKLMISKRGLLAAMAGVLLSTGPALAETRSCQIERVAGTASVTQEGARSPAKPGTALGESDMIRTGDNGMVEILCSDQTKVTIGAQTELNLGSLVGEQGKNESIAMSLHRGIARFLAPVRTWGTFKVFGPAAVASVRSTEWIMETPKRGTNVLVLKGGVEVRSKTSDGWLLGPTYGVDVAADGTMGEPKIWGEARVKKALARVTFPE
jgi:hypothetical protein